MTLSASALIATAALGSLVAYGDESAQPPSRFNRKLAAWRRFNGVGRLESITPSEMLGRHDLRARFVLHVGDFGSHGRVMLTVA